MMTNDELKKKIAQIIAEYCCPLGKTHKQLYGDERQCYSEMNFAECKPITECTDALIAAGIGDVKEEEHRADKAEQLKNQYCRALLNLARRYVVKTNMTLPPVNESNSRSVDIEMLALYIMANECEQAEKELAEENSGKKKI